MKDKQNPANEKWGQLGIMLQKYLAFFEMGWISEQGRGKTQVVAYSNLYKLSNTLHGQPCFGYCLGLKQLMHKQVTHLLAYSTGLLHC